MTDRAPERLGLAIAALAAAAAAALAIGSRRAPADGPAAEFQRALGGLGSGSATTLVPCPRAFDAGTAGACAALCEPIPGASAWCPHHAGASLRPE